MPISNKINLKINKRQTASVLKLIIFVHCYIALEKTVVILANQSILHDGNSSKLNNYINT